jgi:hypothetical protein
LIRKVAIGLLPKQRKVIEVLTVLFMGLAGSRFPKPSAAVAVLNLHWFLERTVAVTVTELVLAAHTDSSKKESHTIIAMRIHIFMTVQQQNRWPVRPPVLLNPQNFINATGFFLTE